MTTTSTSEPQEDEDLDKDLNLPPPTAEWKHFITQLNQDPWEGSITDSGLGTVAMEEGDTNTVGDEVVEGRDGEATADVIPNTDATNDLAWNVDDPP